MKKKYKYYLIIESKTGQLHGAFEHTKEGEVAAKKYIRTIGGFKKFKIESK